MFVASIRATEIPNASYKETRKYANVICMHARMSPCSLWDQVSFSRLPPQNCVRRCNNRPDRHADNINIGGMNALVDKSWLTAKRQEKGPASPVPLPPIRLDLAFFFEGRREPEANPPRACHKRNSRWRSHAIHVIVPLWTILHQNTLHLHRKQVH